MEPVIHWRENVFVQEKWELIKIKKDKHAVCIVSCALLITGAEGFTVNEFIIWKLNPLVSSNLRFTSSFLHTWFWNEVHFISP